MGNAQNSISYKEFNAGLYSDEHLVFPGASFLWGKTDYYKNNTFFDFQFGLAFPTILTGKAGFGIGNEDKPVRLSLGLRLWPSTIYVQLHFKSNFVFSIEPFIANNYFGTSDLFQENAFNTGISIVTIGYRF